MYSTDLDTKKKDLMRVISGKKLLKNIGVKLKNKTE